MIYLILFMSFSSRVVMSFTQLRKKWENVERMREGKERTKCYKLYIYSSNYLSRSSVTHCPVFFLYLYGHSSVPLGPSSLITLELLKYFHPQRSCVSSYTFFLEAHAQAHGFSFRLLANQEKICPQHRLDDSQQPTGRLSWAVSQTPTGSELPSSSL